ETLTAFVCEHAPWTEPDSRAPETMTRFYEDKPRERRADSGPPTDIAAVLSVIVRRSRENRQREKEKDWGVELTGADLRGADLVGAHLEGACLHKAHLERARLSETSHFHQGSLYGGNHGNHLGNPCWARSRPASAEFGRHRAAQAQGAGQCSR